MHHVVQVSDPLSEAGRCLLQLLVPKAEKRALSAESEEPWQQKTPQPYRSKNRNSNPSHELSSCGPWGLTQDRSRPRKSTDILQAPPQVSLCTSQGPNEKSALHWQVREAFCLGVNRLEPAVSDLSSGDTDESKNTAKALKSRVESRTACRHPCCVHHLLNKQGCSLSLHHCPAPQNVSELVWRHYSVFA